jgi:putative glycerol-1-phosphate prenyltransferase
MIRAVRESINIPIIAGGGITTPQKAKTACEAGADIIVVGNAIERDENLISQMADSIHSVASV